MYGSYFHDLHGPIENRYNRCNKTIKLSGLDEDLIVADELDCLVHEFRPELEQRPTHLHKTGPTVITVELFLETISSIRQVDMNQGCKI